MSRKLTFFTRWLLLLVLLSNCGASAAATAAVVASASSQPQQGPLKVFVQTVKDARRHLAAAAVARCTSIVVMYPMDTIKTRIQMGQSNVLRFDGIFRGIAGSLIGQVPYGVLTFGSYEVYKDALLERFPNVAPVWTYAASAILGDLTGSGWLCPSEVVKQQLQGGMYSSTLEAVKGIWAKRGLPGFYQGYLGGISRDVPFRVAQLTSFEVTKSVFLKVKKNRLQQNGQAPPVVELDSLESVACGAIAGTFSAAVTTPLDRIKTLLMTDGPKYGGSVVKCAAQIYQQEGWQGFAAGLAPRVTYIAPSVAIFFVVYEQTQQRLKKNGKANCDKAASDD